jgi:hypothetical protein
MQLSGDLGLVTTFSRVGAVLVAANGCVVVLGWVFDNRLIKSVAPGWATMKTNTACAFIAAGLALLCFGREAARPRILLGRTLALGVAAIGALTLGEYVFATDLGIDQVLFRDLASIPHPGRISPATALSFVLVGVALFNLGGEFVRPRLVSWLVLPPLLISWLAVVGYAYGVDSLYTVGSYSSMALHAAASFFLLGLSILAARPAGRLMEVAMSDTAGGLLARRLMVTIPVGHLVLGWAQLTGQDAGLYDTRFGLSLMVVASTIVGSIMVAWHAELLHRAELASRRTHAEMAALSASLASPVARMARNSRWRSA